MNHFDYRNGVLHAEAVNLVRARGRGRHAVLLLFDRDAGAPLPGVHRGLCRREGADLLRHEGQLQPVGAAHAGEARRRRRRGLRRRIEARARRRHSAARRSCSPASARPRPNCARRSPPTFSASTSNPSRSSSCCRGSRPRSARPRGSRVRVNPDVDAGTHAKISTGKSENKFGIPIARAREVYARAAKLPGIEVTGVDVHIGSQITDLAPLEAAFRDPCRFRADAARRRPRHLACRFRRRPRHSLSHRPRRRRRRRTPMPRWSSASPIISAAR